MKQDYIETINTLQAMINDATPEQWMAIRTAIDAVLQVRAFEEAEQSKWIPVEERLPEENDRYLVTFACETVGTSTWNEDTLRNFGFDADMLGIGEDNKIKHFGVIAWQPLPEAYKGGKQ